jgi:hypothetical protein
MVSKVELVQLVQMEQMVIKDLLAQPVLKVALEAVV